MKRILLGLFVALFLPMAALAATISVPSGQGSILHQNQFHYFDFTDFTKATFSFTRDSLYAGGAVLRTTDLTNTTRPWEATFLTSFDVSPWNPTDIFVWANETLAKTVRYFVVSNNGSFWNTVNVEGEAPAPVPLPAAGFLLLAAVALLMKPVKMLKRAVDYVESAFHTPGTAWKGHDEQMEYLWKNDRAEYDRIYSQAILA